LQDSFAYHDIIDLVLSSPLRRAIQTTVLSFGPTLSRKGVPYLVIPEAQEVSGFTCDVGHTKRELLHNLPELFADEPLQFDWKTINLDAVKEGWNSKACLYVLIILCGVAQITNRPLIGRILVS
jgi:broad specificity phosphatase PhoE